MVSRVMGPFLLWFQCRIPLQPPTLRGGKNLCSQHLPHMQSRDTCVRMGGLAVWPPAPPTSSLPLPAHTYMSSFVARDRLAWREGPGRRPRDLSSLVLPKGPERLDIWIWVGSEPSGPSWDPRDETFRVLGGGSYRETHFLRGEKACWASWRDARPLHVRWKTGRVPPASVGERKRRGATEPPTFLPRVM